LSSHDPAGAKFATSLSVKPATLEWPDPERPVWDTYAQEDGHVAVCLGGTRTYADALLAATSANEPR
jgi:hypothetical protein